jgi:hypothetical protein
VDVLVLDEFQRITPKAIDDMIPRRTRHRTR